ncbi:MAG: DUF2520 domain-containing protein [Planctomycetota bacterium]
MPIRLAIVGPGRVGQALGRRWAESGVDLLGYVGRDRARTAAAVAFAGRGRALQLADLRTAHVVVLAVGDPDLPELVAAAAAAGCTRRCALWLHTSGRHGLSVLAPLAAVAPASGRPADCVRLGALHPVAPFPDAAAGLAGLPDRPAVLLGEPRARRLLGRLCDRLGMRPLWADPRGDRTLYHAACALAANGLTALRAAVDEALAASSVLSPADAARLAQSLMAAALDACARHGAAAALSGPVARGDDATVAAHRTALLGTAAAADADPAPLDEVYRVLMLQALRLARRRGLDDAADRALRRALGAAME